MYVLYLDESGTHGASPAFIVGGLAVHENDLLKLQRRLDVVVKAHSPGGASQERFELHAAEIQYPQRRRQQGKSTSAWEEVTLHRRRRLITAVYDALIDFEPSDPGKPIRFFGAVMQDTHRRNSQRAYEEILHRFDAMLNRISFELDIEPHERGMIVHDRHVIERNLQDWTRRWQLAAGRLGRLDHVVHVPLFADSMASRLIQAADMVCWALWRSYGLPNPHQDLLESILPLFDAADGKIHGLVHMSDGFKGGCGCQACLSRS
jgi:hypothetical protein